MYFNNITGSNYRLLSLSSIKENHLYLLVGSLLLTLYFIQLNLNLRWLWLDNLQGNEVYQQVTGFMLLAYVILQGRLGYHRLRYPKKSFAPLLKSHKLHGVFGPLLFYVHSMDIGFAYQVVLTFIFLGNSLVGYLNPQALKVRVKWYVLSWTIVHVSLALLTLALMLFHIYVVYYYS